MGEKKTREQRENEQTRKEVTRESGNKTHVFTERETPGRASLQAKNVLNISPDDRRSGTIARKENKRT